MFHRTIVFLLIFTFQQSLSAQTDTVFLPKIFHIFEADSPVSIDGRLDEEVWQKVNKYGEWWEHAPEDSRRPTVNTYVMMTYDDNGIYIAGIMEDDGAPIVKTLKRDNFGESDAFAFTIDPVNEKTYGFAFAVNAFGAQTEVIAFPNGDVDESWDNKWLAKTAVYSDHWTVEIYIPFKTLRFKEGNDTWGINFTRVDPGLNEFHVWSPVPRQFDGGDMNYLGQLIWDQAPSSSGGNIALIPYITTSSNKVAGSPATNGVDIGGDAKFAITSGLNLDLTVNPDFSQVEVDNQVSNLTRFNIFFPEKRQFFLENADLFSAYGQGANQPFYSRRIGLDRDGRAIPILYGARLSGNLTSKLRVGVFNMHTKPTSLSPANNYSSLSFQQKLGANSNIKGLLLNRQAYDGTESIDGDYGRNIGGEVNLSTKAGDWSGQLGYIHSGKEGFTDKNKHLYGRINYSSEKFRTFLFVQNIGENYFADMGFNARINNFNPTTGEVVRIGYTQVGSMLNYYIYPKSKKINYHWSGIENFVIVNNGGLLNEWYTRFRHFVFYQNTSQLRFRINKIFYDLVFPFALTETPLPAEQYHNWEFNVQYLTDQRKIINAQLFAVYGQFYSGTKLSYIFDVNLRCQPWGNFSLGLEQNLIRLPEPHGNLDITLANAKAEINFSTSLFWTTFLQYNTQANRFNVNTRLQWRYGPMSDIFLVYTDNYLTSGSLRATDRSIVLKANYWLGI